MLQLAIRTWDRLLGRPARRKAEDDERRVWVRFPCNLATTVVPTNGPPEDRLSARVQNISRGGINLVIGRQFEPGSVISVDLPGAEGEASSAVLAYVVHVTKRGDGEWALGCTFATELTDEDLEPFGARRVKPGSADQRSWVRFPCAARALYQVLRSGEANPLPARVFNISPNGVGLLTAAGVDLGRLLTLELHDPKGTSPLTIMASVVRVSARGEGEWALGCNFIRELTDAELRALL